MFNIFIKIKTKYENSNYYNHMLISQYKPLIVPVERTPNEMLAIIQNYFDVAVANKNIVSDIFWNLMVLENLNDKPNNPDFKIYKILNNSKSKKLYKQDNENDVIFIIFESNNNFFISNSTTVQQILLLSKGISDFDYRNNTHNLINYLRIYKDFKSNHILNEFIKEISCVNN